MDKIGLILVLLGVVGNFIFDRMFKKGKIEKMETMLKYKMIALGVTIVGCVLAIYFYPI